MDLNRASIIGRLTRDPELRTTTTGKTVANMTVATGYTWKDQAGNRQEKSEFHNCVLWGRLGEIAGQYLSKGRRVFVEGRIETRSWDGQDGVKRYRTEVIVQDMIMLDGGSRGGGNAAPAPSAGGAEQLPTIQADQEINVEDIPF